jgi:hypothetical protein
MSSVALAKDDALSVSPSVATINGIVGWRVRLEVHLEKRHGTGAFQDAPRSRERWISRQRPGVRRPSAAFLSPIRILKFVDGRTRQLALFGREVRVESQ